MLRLLSDMNLKNRPQLILLRKAICLVQKIFTIFIIKAFYILRLGLNLYRAARSPDLSCLLAIPSGGAGEVLNT